MSRALVADDPRVDAPWAPAHVTFGPVEWRAKRVGGLFGSRIVVALVSRGTPWAWARISAAANEEDCRGADVFRPWYVQSSAIDPRLYRQGWGTALYLELFRQITAAAGHTAVGSDYCCGGSTSPEAQAVWDRLGRLFNEPGEGRCRWIRISPQRVSAAIRAWDARRGVQR